MITTLMEQVLFSTITFCRKWRILPTLRVSPKGPVCNQPRAELGRTRLMFYNHMVFRYIPRVISYSQ
jgi:hypothetical protein